MSCNLLITRDIARFCCDLVQHCIARHAASVHSIRGKQLAQAFHIVHRPVVGVKEEHVRPDLHRLDRQLCWLCWTPNLLRTYSVLLRYHNTKRGEGHLIGIFLGLDVRYELARQFADAEQHSRGESHERARKSPALKQRKSRRGTKDHVTTENDRAPPLHSCADTEPPPSLGAFVAVHHAGVVALPPVVIA